MREPTLLDEEKLLSYQGFKTPLEGVGFNYQSLFSPFNKAFKQYLSLDERDFSALLDALPKLHKHNEEDFFELKFEDLLKLPVALSKNEVNQVAQKENDSRVDAFLLSVDNTSNQDDELSDELVPKFRTYTITLPTPEPAFIPPVIMVPPPVVPSNDLPAAPSITVDSAFTGGINTETLLNTKASVLLTGNIFTEGAGGGVRISAYFESPARAGSTEDRTQFNKVILTTPEGNTFTLFTGSTTDNWIGDFIYELKHAVPHHLNTHGLDVVEVSGHKIFTEHFQYSVTNQHNNANVGSIKVQIVDDVPVATNQNGASIITEADIVSIGSNQSIKAPTVNGSLLSDPSLAVNRFGPDGGNVFDVYMANNAGNVVATLFTITVTTPEGNVLVVNRSTGAYTYTLNQPFNNTTNPNATFLQAQDTFFYELLDNDGDTATATLTISISDDKPIGTQKAKAASETLYFVNGSEVVTGNLITDNNGFGASQLGADGATITTVNGANPVGGIINTATTYGNLTVYTTAQAGHQVGYYSYALDGTETAPLNRALIQVTDSISYVLTDNDTPSTSSSTLNVTITLNQPPTAVNDSKSTDALSVLSVNAAMGVLANDTDPNTGDVLKVSAMNGQPAAVGVVTALPSGAIITLNSDGSYNYNPNGVYNYLAQGVTTTEDINYTIVDAAGYTSSATLTITITGLNDAPVAVDDSNATNEDTVLSVGVGAGNLLANDSDVDVGDTLTVGTVQGSAANVGQSIFLPSGAMLTVNANGSYDYDPNGQFTSLAVGASTTDSFVYQAEDNHGVLSNTATVTITINGTNQPPVANDINTSTHYLGVINIISTNDPDNIIMNDSDPDGDALTISAVNGNGANVGTQITLPSGALLTVQANGNYAYDPNGSFPAGGNDSFTYTVSDSHGGSSSAQVDITVIFPPVVLDLNDDGISLIALENSKTVWQFPCGNYHSTGWVGPEDGILVYDYNKDGKITELKEFNFASYHPDAHTDLEGLLLFFDTNHDGIFDINDDLFSEFSVWQDRNSNGITDEGELRSLIDMGIKYISLNSNHQKSFNEGNVIFGETYFETTDGKKHIAADVGLKVGKEINFKEVISTDCEIDFSALETSSQSTKLEAALPIIPSDASGVPEVIIFNPIAPHEELVVVVF